MRSHSDARHLIEIKVSAVQGLGVFATADLPRGTRVIAETALFNLNQENESARDILGAFKKLSVAQQTISRPTRMCMFSIQASGGA